MQVIPQPIEQGVGTETDSVRKSVMKTISHGLSASASRLKRSRAVREARAEQVLSR